jgi:alpha-tubulin suppressor-like RCC1 family protein
MRRFASVFAFAVIGVTAACKTEHILESSPTFTVGPRSSLVQEGMLLQLKAFAPPDGAIPADNASWSSSNASVATVDASGLVTALSPGTALIRITWGGVSDSAFVSVKGAEGASLVAYGRTTCGATTTAGEVCWGENRYGQTGTRVPDEIVFLPTPVPAAVTWRSISAGWNHTCGVDTLFDIYCWGLNNVGQLGMATFSDPVLPSKKVQTEKKFVSVAAGGPEWQTRIDEEVFTAQLTCGVTREGEALCWGFSGNTARAGDSPTNIPKPVAPGIQFVSVSVGNGYACGVATDRRGYCWGNNDFGQLGRAQSAFDRAPKEIEGNLRFESISAGGLHACGVTLTGQAYCWGNNETLQLGATSTGTCLFRGIARKCSPHPVQVEGSFRFKSVVASSWGSTTAITAFTPAFREHTCGITVDQDIVCWGNNDSGRIMRRFDITEPFELPPTRLPFLEKFRTVAVGESHTCGVLINGQVWCWGDNTRGQQGIPQGQSRIEFGAVAGVFVYK